MEGTLLGLRHVALNVQDIPRSVKFYTEVLGMRVEWQPDPDNVYLTSGTDNLALHKLREARVSAPAQSLDHIGFIVRKPEDVDTWAARLGNIGIPLVQEPRTHRDGARSCYFRDPDGLLIQLIYHPPISDQG